MNKKILFVLMILFISGLTSCSKEYDYEVKIVNHTNYHIKNMKLGCSIDIPDIEVKPNSTSKTIIFCFQKNRFTISEPLLCPKILTFSSPQKTYENTSGLGSTNSMSEFKDDQMNYININLDPNFTDSLDIFSITVNE